MGREKVEVILGKEFFQGLRDFYRKIEESDYIYKVCLVRRSYVLGQIFYNIVEEKHSDGKMNPCITDSALISLCPELVEYFIANKHFPGILVVDDILIHGRAINAFLVRLEDELIRCFHDREYEIDDDDVRTELSYAISIWIYIRNNKTSVLLVRYQARVTCWNIESAVVWRNLSNRISILISESGLANANYILSSVSQNFDDIGENYFRKITTYYRDSLETAYIRILDFGSGPKAILTVRDYALKGSEKKRVIPFVFLPEISAKSRMWITDVIDERLKEKGYNEFSVLKWEKLYRISNEFISLVLSQNLWFIFSQMYHINLREEIGTEEERQEINKIAHNYGNSKQIKELIQYIKENQLFTEQELVEIIGYITQDSQTLFTYSSENISAQQKSNLLTIMENIIFEQGQDSEWEAYRLKRESYIPTKLQYRESKENVNEFWEQIYQRAQDEFSIYYVVAYTLQFMDVGIMVLSVYKSYDADRQSYCQYCKAGEQSLMIQPLRLYLYIPLMVAMYRKCSIGGRDFDHELWEWKEKLGIPENKCKEIIHYMHDLEQVGQTIYDWDFNMRTRVYRDDDLGDDIYRKIERNLDMANEQKKLVTEYLG